MKLNRHQIAGRIVEDPEYGAIPGSGVPTIKLRVMTDDGWYDQKKQEYQKRNTYHTVKRINKDVDQMQLRKDDWVFVEGQLLTDMWEDRNGDKKYANFIRALFITEIPDPWEKRNTGSGGGGYSSGRNDGRDDRRDSRGHGRRDSRRDDNRGSQQGGGRNDYRDDRRDDRGSRQGDNQIPF